MIDGDGRLLRCGDESSIDLRVRRVKIITIIINTRIFVSLTITFHIYSHDSTRHRDVLK